MNSREFSNSPTRPPRSFVVDDLRCRRRLDVEPSRCRAVLFSHVVERFSIRPSSRRAARSGSNCRHAQPSIHSRHASIHPFIHSSHSCVISFISFETIIHSSRSRIHPSSRHSSVVDSIRRRFDVGSIRLDSTSIARARPSRDRARDRDRYRRRERRPTSTSTSRGAVTEAVIASRVTTCMRS